jgi:flagellar L-ring protein precursor FlgH
MTRLMQAAAILFCFAAQASAASIWARANCSSRGMYADDTARAIGDNLTILISETTRATNATNRTLEKKASRSANVSGTAEPGNIFGNLWRRILQLPTIDIATDAETKFDGKADYDTNRLLSDRVTVTVHDILPNGNLVVVGRRERVVDRDKHVVEVSGIVRPSDVSFANTVSSDMIADFQINVKLMGQEREFTNPGWLSRVLNFLSPW